MKKTLTTLALAFAISGCASTGDVSKLGTIVYIPHGQVGQVTVHPPAAPASGAR